MSFFMTLLSTAPLSRYQPQTYAGFPANSGVARIVIIMRYKPILPLACISA